jgi:hypothetical protein
MTRQAHVGSCRSAPERSPQSHRRNGGAGTARSLGQAFGAKRRTWWLDPLAKSGVRKPGPATGHAKRWGVEPLSSEMLARLEPAEDYDVGVVPEHPLGEVEYAGESLPGLESWAAC